MRRYRVITAATAALVIGGGVAFGSTRQHQTPTPPTRSPMPALSQIERSLQMQCEQGVVRVQGKYTEAYDAGCNSGSATLTVP